MYARPLMSRATSKGFSLLEVLIASTVFSLGMAGISALLLVNLGSSAQSRNASTATVAAANLAEQILLNPLATSQYINPASNVTTICRSTHHGPVLCTPQQQADYDFNIWKQELAAQIHNSTGVVCNDSSPEDGDRNNSRCDGAGTMVIKIFWGGPPTTSGQTSNEYRYTLAAG